MSLWGLFGDRRGFCRFSCLFLVEVDIRQDVAGLLLAILDDVGINVLRGGSLGVPQHLGDGHHVCALGDQHRGCRVPKGMGIDNAA